jgi:uncharacterized membrane protein YkoI
MNPVKKAALGAALVGSTLVGGALGASFLGTAGAQDSTTTTAPATAQAPQQNDGQAPPSGQQAPNGPQRDPSKGGHQANGITETVLTGDAASKATEAAKAAVDGGTVERVENDAEGAAYEAHVVKSDGSHVTVKMDASFKVTSVEDGMR